MKKILFDSKIRNIVLFLFVVLIYVGIPLSILFGLVDFKYKFYALTIGGIIVYAVLRLLGFTNTTLGITLAKTKESIISVLPITILLVVIGIILWGGGFSRMTPNEQWPFFVFYIFLSSPIQEFLYRGALEAVLNELEISSMAIRMVTTSALYSFVHIIYRDWLTLMLTFAIGLIWYFCYRKSKNLIGVSISHAVLGVVTIVAGIID